MPAKGQKLAYISPLPPAKSGIADYSAELVQELARFYQHHFVHGNPADTPRQGAHSRGHAGEANAAGSKKRKKGLP